MKDKPKERITSFFRVFFRIIAVVLIVFVILFLLKHYNINIPFFGDDSAVAMSSDEKAAAEEFCSAELGVYFISVGQADSIFLKQGESTMLIDCGDYEDSDEIIRNLKKLGVSHIDTLVLTHPHSDHIGGAQSVIRSIDTDKIYMPRKYVDTVAFDKLTETILFKNIEVEEAFAGKEFSFGDAVVSVLSPVKGQEYENLNSYSVVLLLEYDGVKMMFCGDAEYENEDMILSSGYDIDCELVKIAHHGSFSSSSWDFVKEASAEFAIATTEYNSEDGLPKEDIIKRWERSGAKVLCTHEYGDICALVNDGEIKIITELQPSDNN